MASPSREGNKICSLPQCGWSSAPVHSWCCCWHSDTGGVMAVGVVHGQKPQHGFHSWDGIFLGKTHFQVVVRTVLPIAIGDGRLSVCTELPGRVCPSSHLIVCALPIYSHLQLSLLPIIWRAPFTQILSTRFLYTEAFYTRSFYSLTRFTRIYTQ